MSNLISTFQERFGDWLTALGQHLIVSFDLIIAIFLSIPLAIYLSTRERASNWVLQLCWCLSNHPSMALLGLFIPIMGNWNASCFNSSSHLCDIPNFAKYYYRIAGIDPSLEEAGIAFG